MWMFFGAKYTMCKKFHHASMIDILSESELQNEYIEKIGIGIVYLMGRFPLNYFGVPSSKFVNFIPYKGSKLPLNV